MYFSNVIYSCDGKADFGVQESFLIIINVEYSCGLLNIYVETITHLEIQISCDVFTHHYKCIHLNIH